MAVVTRFIPALPIFSRYEGCCGVCKEKITPGELISPFFYKNYNLWRHTDCLQLFYLDSVKYSGNCLDCLKDIDSGGKAYWSKHNGIYCISCTKKISPKVLVATSRFGNSKIRNRERRAIS